MPSVMPSTNDKKIIRKLKKLIESWGGSLTAVDSLASYRENEEFEDAPFNWLGLGVIWKTKEIIYVPKLCKWPDLIHDMGHVFACKKSPSNSEEFTFLGWEFALAKYIEAPMKEWYEAMGNYVISATTHEELGGISPAKRASVLRERVRAAKRNKLIVDGRPVSIR